jgi:hypothetical protein
MIKVLNITIVVLCGVVGGWTGYWAGYALGWSEHATWPQTIGGGTGAILLSMGLAVLFVALAALVVFFVPQRGVRRVLRSGATAQATVVRAVETGAVSWAREGGTHQVRCDLEVCPRDAPPYRARTTQFVSAVVEGVLQPGAEVIVRYDPDHPSRVAIEEPFARAA